LLPRLTEGTCSSTSVGVIDPAPVFRQCAMTSGTIGATTRQNAIKPRFQLADVELMSRYRISDAVRALARSNCQVWNAWTAALWAGTNEATIKRHYREVLTPEAGETWFKTGVTFTAEK
jgi:hypothetical protein